MATSDRPWWIWRSVQTRLIKWTLLLLNGRKYVVELTTKIDTGAHYPELKRIEVNPEMFPRESVDVQFRATQGLLLHEVGHAPLHRRLAGTERQRAVRVGQYARG